MAGGKKRERREKGAPTPPRAFPKTMTGPPSPVVIPVARAEGRIVADLGGEGENLTSRPTGVFSEGLDSGVVLVPGAMPPFIGVPEDTLRLGLKEYSEAFEARRQWLLPFTGLLATGIPVLAVSQFRSFGPMSKEQVADFANFVALGFLIWLVTALVRMAFKKPMTADDIIERCRLRRGKQDG